MEHPPYSPNMALSDVCLDLQGNIFLESTSIQMPLFDVGSKFLLHVGTNALIEKTLTFENSKIPCLSRWIIDHPAYKVAPIECSLQLVIILFIYFKNRFRWLLADTTSLDIF
jgi:hypothetical protein